LSRFGGDEFIVIMEAESEQKVREKADLILGNVTKLSEESGVNLRAIQQYEARSKDINKAAGKTLLSLARALSCRIEDCWNMMIMIQRTRMFLLNRAVC
ncbi:MAG: hypothetical protein IKN52_12055, partial [Victivallales bacterium]|nr:hypothetical protein [Victivallales bacterium]